MLAFSTNWNVSRQREGGALIQEILDLGFDTIELGHGLNVSQLHGIRQYRERANFTILSVHNFCPNPVEVLTDNPDCYEFSSHRSQERERALRLTLQTLETAREFGARFVVLHLGRILPLRGMTDGLLTALQEKGVASRDYARLKLEAVKKREKSVRVYLNRVVSVLEPIIEEASRLGIVLGIENRSDFEAIPTERELLALIKRFDTPHLRYWHDFGHAQMRENLGLLDHAQWLADVAPYAAGAHLQDATWPDKDHLIPFEGEIPFDLLVPLLPSSLPYILELSSRSQPDAIRAAVVRWNSRFDS
jgi:sugar phosphate isomerase/epimerase